MPGETNVIQHRVKLTGDTPIRCKPYPLLYAMKEELGNEVDSMLEMGVVRPSMSPHASPIIMVIKKDGSNKVCMDFVTPEGQYEFLRMPFGMVNAGDTLVRRLKKVLKGLSGVSIDLAKLNPNCHMNYSIIFTEISFSPETSIL